MKSAQVRQQFLDFFNERGHTVVPSSPLVPGNDPTLLFTNAGMVQFKDVFLGQERRDYVRAVSAQRCVRAGGKHNDLENVGYTARHHTFFEMLGNFSFGDYFKTEAIEFAWDMVTNCYGLAPEKLWVTVFEDDDEAADLWLKHIGIDPSRFSRLGAKDNFWAMGDTGPCGPCSEIFYDHGPDVSGGPPGSPYEDGDRYVEIWNLVFMQFDRSADGTMTPLPQPSVDTGMGLERMAAVMQGVHSNYQIDLFANLIEAAARLTNSERLDQPSLQVIADHIRACSFLVADGVLPSNDGRGYVLRRIIRRAIRHGYKLGVHDPFFYRLVAPLEREMGAAYPELGAQRAHIERVLKQEEDRFAETLDQGMGMLENAIGKLHGEVIPGKVVFKLYDTYGFPLDLTEDIARERQLLIDHAGFKQEMEAQRARARAHSKFGADQDGLSSAATSALPPTRFGGHAGLSDQSVVLALFRDGTEVDALENGEHGQVVLEKTPFYAESGGQVGDTGAITGESVRFDVEDTVKVGGVHAHVGRVSAGRLEKGSAVSAAVNAERRQDIVLNHSATHLMHAALRQVLGEHVQQKGSLVAPDRLRFDFSHYEPMTAAEIEQVEDLVNEQIRINAAAEAAEMSYDEAINSGAMALFGEKYGDRVRVLRIGEFSTELCGGTHVARAGDIGLFKIVSESGVAAGVRRIEAVSGRGALAVIKANESLVRRLAALVKANRDNLGEKVAHLVERGRLQDKEIEQLKMKLAGGQGTDLAAQAIDVGGINVLAAEVDGADSKTLRDAVDRLKDKLGTAVIVLGAKTGEDKVALVAGVTKNITDRFRAGDAVNVAAEIVGGRGGGRPDMARAGGREPARLGEALAEIEGWVRQQLET
ncbi:MAG: alanine--tRNA ligase [Rhodospirillales bacterium]|jgi:alanyl-tRNA synthetase|nr:alanine--tRNA ligase [Rhodospirillales bacterium]